jgi:hypothetical protein
MHDLTLEVIYDYVGMRILTSTADVSMVASSSQRISWWCRHTFYKIVIIWLSASIVCATVAMYVIAVWLWLYICGFVYIATSRDMCGAWGLISIVCWLCSLYDIQYIDCAWAVAWSMLPSLAWCLLHNFYLVISDKCSTIKT